MLNMIHEYVRKGESFAFETTMSGRGYARWIPRWQEQGYRVKLYFLRLPTPEMAIARVRQRVLQGGHDVPEHDRSPPLPRRVAQFRSPPTGIWWMTGRYTTIRGTSPVLLAEESQP